MKRRDFLKTVAVSVGALIVGCGPKDENNTDNNISTNNTNGTTGTNNAMNEVLEPGTEFFPQSLASGDPSDSTVVLWTRVFDGDGDLELELQVAQDAEFTQRLELNGGEAMMLTASAAFNNCVKARLTELDASTHYYYRFIYEKDGVRYTSNVGRTKTAPAADADVAAKFAFVSCQDFNGRYFNAYKQLVKDEEFDFFVHLGDYVYETTGDPQFQVTTPDRSVVFTNPGEAIVFNEGTDDEYRAAKSLSNYRDLYQHYRSDEWLQKAHEMYPCIAIWDDHEFSDDCFGATATYFDGAADELDVDRRKAANQAWYEYMPVDYLDAPDFQYDSSATYGDDIRIYRDIRWGANCHLVMTDLRSYRADHVIPEDLFPGAVLMTQAELEADQGTLPAWADPYVDVDTYGGGIYATALTGAGLPAAAVTGNLSVTYINAVVTGVNETLPMDMQIPLIDPTGLEAGLTGVSLGKTGVTGMLGARYFVVDEPFNVWGRKRYADTSGASETTMGDAQETWFLDTMQGSDATWKIWGNEFTLSQRAIDLTALAAVVGDAFAKRFLLSAEDWDGMRNKRDELISQLSDVGNVVAITGDIHAFFAGTPFNRDDPSKRIVEFVTSAISSGSMKTLLINTANSNDSLREAGAVALAEQIANFLFNPSRPNPPLAYGSVDEHGFSVIECDAAALNCTFHKIAEEHVFDDVAEGDLDALFTTKSFRVDAGSPELYSEIQGTDKRWDTETSSWV